MAARAAVEDSPERTGYAVRYWLPGLDMVSPKNAVGVSISPQGVLANKIFGGLKEEHYRILAQERGCTSRDLSDSEIKFANMGAEILGRIAYRQALDRYGLDGVVTDMGTYFREVRKREKVNKKVALTRTLASYYIERDWEFMSPEEFCRTHKIPLVPDKEIAQETLSTYLSYRSPRQLLAIQRSVEAQKNGYKTRKQVQRETQGRLSF